MPACSPRRFWRSATRPSPSEWKKYKRGLAEKVEEAAHANSPTAVKYSIVTFGCRVNQADSFQIEEQLIAAGGAAAGTRRTPTWSS